MTMTEQMQHTPGPWRVVEKGQGLQESWREIWAGNLAVVSPDGYYSAKYEDFEFGVAISEPNARRIVACVNACEGIPTEALEAGVVRELVEALKALVGEIEWEIGEEKWGRDPDALSMARTVLAKVRG